MTYIREISVPAGTIIFESEHPDYLGRMLIGDNLYNTRIANDSYKIICTFDKSRLREPQTYREEMLGKGIYAGHHRGKPISASVSAHEMCVYIGDLDVTIFNKFIWNFSLKYILTVMALQAGGLHLKGTSLLHEGKAILLLGRGGSGKTTLSRYLQNKGVVCLGNTHAILKNNTLWALNTWVRIRGHEGEERYELIPQVLSQDAQLERILIVDHNKEGRFEMRAMNRDRAKAFLTYFSGATGNYDLKEEIADSCDEFEDSFQLLHRELELIDNCLDQNEIIYLSGDIQDIEFEKNFFQYLRRSQQ